MASDLGDFPSVVFRRPPFSWASPCVLRVALDCMVEIFDTLRCGSAGGRSSSLSLSLPLSLGTTAFGIERGGAVVCEEAKEGEGVRGGTRRKRWTGHEERWGKKEAKGRRTDCVYVVVFIFHAKCGELSGERERGDEGETEWREREKRSVFFRSDSSHTHTHTHTQSLPLSQRSYA
jgi:hypothetical protein